MMIKQKKQIKEYDKLLEKYISQKECVKIFRTICGEEENLFGFVLAMSKDFFLLQLVDDFCFNGYAIIPKNGFDSIRCGRFEKTYKRIIKSEGEFETNFGCSLNIELKNWQSVFRELRKNDFHVIIQNIRKDYLDFWIGPIKRVSKNSVSIHNYNPSGKFDDKPNSIILNTIKDIKFGDRYSLVFRKYLKH